MSKLKVTLGAASCILFTCCIILSWPVYVWRQVAILLARLFRPDLGNILNGISSGLAVDYMTKETPPRSNCVLAMIFQGRVLKDDVKSRVLQNWIMARETGSGQLVYDNFQRYPITWLGFYFWKKASSSFSIENHVQRFSNSETVVTESKLAEIMENLLNEQYPPSQSPWKLVVIENYLNPKHEKEPASPCQPHSVLILKWHHCLMDGTGVMKAICEGLYQQPWNMTETRASPRVPIPKKIINFITTPACAVHEMSIFLSYIFRDYAFKVPNEKKTWHQSYATSGPIPINVIKDIKNKFGVSYSSVLYSAASSAVHKTLAELETKPPYNKSMPSLYILPAIGNGPRKIFTNRMTGVVFDLPTTDFDNPGERLLLVNKLLENSRNSVMPILGQWYCTITGTQPWCYIDCMTKNRMIPIGLTNFSAVAHDMSWDSNTKWIASANVVGGHRGVTGVVISSVSHGNEVRVQVSAEKSLFPKKRLQDFVKHIKEEIVALQNASPLDCRNNSV